LLHRLHRRLALGNHRRRLVARMTRRLRRRAAARLRLRHLAPQRRALGARRDAALRRGRAQRGQLGHGGSTSEATPRRVEALRHTRVVGLAGGHFHSLALAEDDTVYTWGAASHGELGHPIATHQPTPRALAAVRGRRLLFAACGGTHTALLLGGRRRERERDVAESGATSDETS